MFTKDTSVMKNRTLFLAVNNGVLNYDKPFSEEQFRLVEPGGWIKEEC
jgi:hypothetical protein